MASDAAGERHESGFVRPSLCGGRVCPTERKQVRAIRQGGSERRRVRRGRSELGFEVREGRSRKARHAVVAHATGEVEDLALGVGGVEIAAILPRNTNCCGGLRATGGDEDGARGSRDHSGTDAVARANETVNGSITHAAGR